MNGLRILAVVMLALVALVASPSLASANDCGCGAGRLARGGFAIATAPARVGYRILANGVERRHERREARRERRESARSH